MDEPHWLADDAFARFKHIEDIIRAADNTTNEDTTRMRAIDTVLFDVLGWDRREVQTEAYVREKGFADYQFADNILILEAKRSGRYFVLGDHAYPDRPVPFSLIAQECPEAAFAMRQAQGYAASKGAHYIAISNGHQWLLTIAFVLNQDIADRSVYVFESVDAIKGRFRRFWECFSRTSLVAHTPSMSLLESRRMPAPAKLSAHIPNYPAPADRNRLKKDIARFVLLIWDEINQHDEYDTFLEHCYVQPERAEDDLLLARDMLTQRLDADALTVAEAEDATTLANMIASPSPEKPVVVLGRVGHGKTTFLRYLRQHAAKHELERYLQFDIDFLNRPKDATEIDDYFFTTLDYQLRTRYNIDITENKFVRATLHADLVRFGRTPLAKLHAANKEDFARAELEQIQTLVEDRHNYFGKAFLHLKRSHRCSIAIFVDNLDRRNDDLQEEAFLQATAMAHDWSVTLFVCLRPGTFQRSVDRGVLDSLAPRIITITSPKANNVLRLRFRYAGRLAAGKIEPTPTQAAALHGIKDSERPYIAKIFAAFDDSLFTNKDLPRLFDAVANGNIRAMLRYTREVITSGHLNTDKILDRIERSGSYTVSEHEALRALLYTDYQQYVPHSSVFVNLFDIDYCDPLEHFSRPITLHYLNTSALADRSFGFVKCDQIFTYLSGLGFALGHITRMLEHLYSKDCIEGKLHGASWSHAGELLRLTPLGRYHITHLIRTMEYIDAVVVDTPILDAAARMQITNVEDISRRLERSRLFLRYLTHCAEGLAGGALAAWWTEINDAVANDITDIEKHA